LDSIRKAVSVGILLCSITLSIGGCSQADKFPTGWRRIEAGAFSLYAPPGWEFRKRQGIDSYVGEFAGDGVVLTFDFGQYSNSLSDVHEPSYVVVHEFIHGSWAKVVSPKRPGQGITGIYFAGAPNIINANKLCVVGHDLTAFQQEVALRIFRTIRFKR
jgi:hypothetical protein